VRKLPSMDDADLAGRSQPGQKGQVLDSQASSLLPKLGLAWLRT
jgi:hypothetical protein